MSHKTVERQIRSFLTELEFGLKKIKKTYEYQYIFKVLAPYAVLKERDILIVVNRFYKPLGVPSGSNVNYADYSSSILDGSDLIHSNCYQIFEENKIAAFYNDGSKPWESRKLQTLYIERLKLFLKTLNVEQSNIKA